jgi:hypothetical protein
MTLSNQSHFSGFLSPWKLSSNKGMSSLPLAPVNLCQVLEDKNSLHLEKTGLMLFVPDGLLKTLYAVQGDGMPSGS